MSLYDKSKAKMESENWDNVIAVYPKRVVKSYLSAVKRDYASRLHLDPLERQRLYDHEVARIYKKRIPWFEKPCANLTNPRV